MNKLLFSFAIPGILGLLSGFLYIIVDTIFVGRGVGPLGIAALSIALPILLSIMAIGLMVGTGSASIISRALGKNDVKRAVNSMGNGVILNLLLNITFIALAYIFIDRVLLFFGASADVIPIAKEYLIIVFPGFILLSFLITTNDFVRAEGKPRAAMYFIAVGSILNIILDPIFIFGFKMGIRGAAVATLIGETLSTILIIWFYIWGKSIYKLKPSTFRIDFKKIKEILLIGCPTFIMMTVTSVVILIFNRSLRVYGNDIHIAILGIGYRMIGFIQVPIVVISQSFATISSFNYGAKKYQRVKKILWLTIIWTSIISLIAFIPMMFFPGYFLSIFSSNQSLINMGIMPLRLLVAFFPFVGMHMVSASFFQSLGKPVQSLLITSTKQFLFLIPAIYLLPKIFGLNGIWLAMPVADFLSITIAGIFIFCELRIFNRKTSSEVLEIS
ncbi:MAG: MATE family efflux transporter [Actinomycetota bacterium]|nr:MATE family efflux transporter [Actinomycetota bacterium]